MDIYKEEVQSGHESGRSTVNGEICPIVSIKSIKLLRRCQKKIILIGLREVKNGNNN